MKGYMKRNTKGEFKAKVSPTKAFALTLILIGFWYTFGLYMDNTKLKAELNYQRAYTKSIESKGLAHYINSQKEPNYKVAKITAYSCGGIKTEAELDMNCPSLRGGRPRTADGSTPIPYKTMACDKSLLGQEFDIQGVGTVRCTDTGGAIKGEGRFDLYVYDINEALNWGTKYVIYEAL